MKWYVKAAPVRLKLVIAFGLQFGLVAVAGLLGTGTFGTGLGGATGHAMLAAILAASAIAGFACRAAIANPYVATVERMEALAAGNITTPVRFTDHTDCVGRLTVAMEVFRTNAVARREAEAEAGAVRAAADEERGKNERARAQASANQKEVVEELAKALISLANGDLSYKINKFFSVDYKTLRMDFNLASSRMESTMHNVIISTNSVSTGSREINGAAADLARRIEQQAAQLEQSAATLAEVTGTVEQTSQNAKSAAELAAAARADATASSTVVRDTINAMTGIEASARQIANIISVIDEIAFQTNLLALNAGVEAARAGDAGRGFTVVATEVRALAQRSADAAKEIKALISASGKQVGTGVKLVNETGHTLQRITGQISDLAELVQGIAGAANQQATALKRVNSSVSQMDRVTQENAAMVEETNAASQSLFNEADKLTAMLCDFKVGSAPAEAGAVNASAARQQQMKSAVPRTAAAVAVAVA
ncbi:methyl-accepting chemotaxis protein [Acidisoma sp.]|uniref:methyl-accepting chemotaxis protein n=1 Tax=Acidisoma sp. TaxID=1872115 RepID=UPI003B0035CA